MLLNKKVLFLIILFIFCIFFPKITYAHSGDKIKKIDISIEIKEDGSASFKEEWYVNSFGRYGYTKIFKGIETNQILDYSVTDEEQIKYELINNFDKPMEDGSYINKCGIIKNGDNGVFLFWGVDEQKDHQYTLTYTIKDFVKELSDSKLPKGINFDFIDERN